MAGYQWLIIAENGIERAAFSAGDHDGRFAGIFTDSSYPVLAHAFLLSIG